MRFLSKIIQPFDARIDLVQHKIFLTLLFLSLFLSCESGQRPLSSNNLNSDKKSDLWISHKYCEVYGHGQRIDAFTGATILVEKPSNKKQQIIHQILNLPELSKMQTDI